MIWLENSSRKFSQIYQEFKEIANENRNYDLEFENNNGIYTESNKHSKCVINKKKLNNTSV